MSEAVPAQPTSTTTRTHRALVSAALSQKALARRQHALGEQVGKAEVV